MGKTKNNSPKLLYLHNNNKNKKIGIRNYSTSTIMGFEINKNHLFNDIGITPII